MFSVKNGLKSGLFVALLAMGANLGAAELRMATTTSTDNTGLLDVLAPAYKKDTGVDLKWVAVGTGNALKLGENCDVDVVFVHAPKVELEYVEKGFGIDRTPVMYNDFVIIGNPSFKQKFTGMSVAEAFKLIEKDQVKFVSRGDKSGTHSKEREVWKEALGKIPEKESWYIEAGQGMLATINIAEEQKGLTLTDRGTFIKYESNHKGKPPMVIVLEGDNTLKNFYSIMAVNPKRCEKADYKGAKQFIDWIVSEKMQAEIANFKLLDKQLFTPDAKTRK
ncbi:tungstate ABC transporter substrate-binding protein TupA [Wolinella succinogenes]|uniref:tungstate ABC transporter substrate-binding protein TupA n=1 Tax=Wolinella succinogenes TaxID=844 RepID=UPI001696DFBA|nr:tungstate ABC transporter substrate-binding protein TupA [Wolinella succinogenes]NLU35142.1 tungsten ABC transporter substrate-binding protein [Wolinella succinogenes]